MASEKEILSRGNNRLTKIIQSEIKDQNLIKTGDLLKSIDAKFTIRGTKVTIKIGAMYYYTYLDRGTKYIKSRDITKNVVNSKRFNDLMEEVAAEYFEYLIEINL